jgi:DNA-binding transcriptional regulator YdaS (Cro superfamily)
MKEVLAYLATLPPAERDAFAARCGTTVGYLRKAASVGQRIGEGIAICIERESNRAVTVEQLRPDVDWAYIRGTEPTTKEAA